MSFVLRLAETQTLWISFVATILLTAAFQVLIAMFDLILLDGISDPEQARAAIASMSEHQRTVHVWMTGTLDVAYPAAYGALLIGSAYKFFPKAGHFLAAPTFVLIPTDLIEGVVQILALMGVTDWLDSKAILTTLKGTLFSMGLLIMLCGWLRWAVGRLLSLRGNTDAS